MSVFPVCHDHFYSPSSTSGRLLGRFHLRLEWIDKPLWALGESFSFTGDNGGSPTQFSNIIFRHWGHTLVDATLTGLLLRHLCLFSAHLVQFLQSLDCNQCLLREVVRLHGEHDSLADSKRVVLKLYGWHLWRNYAQGLDLTHLEAHHGWRN